MALKEVIYTDRFSNIPLDRLQEILVVTEDAAFAHRLRELDIATALDETEKEGRTVHSQAADDGKMFSCPYVILHPEEMEFFEFDRIYRRQKKIPWDILTTERCLVREFCMEDLDDLMNLYRQPGVTDYLDPLGTCEEERQRQSDYIRCVYGLFEYGMWIVIDRATGRLIGRAGIETSEFCGDGEAELGYVIDPSFQKQGIATEVCEAILYYAREELGFHHFFVRVRAGNEASLALARKLGVEIRLV